ncbi:hypothetical protein OHS18_20400 [Amycolatopsis sp. NBC_00355]|uniref:hypothetical protein n=1 Tax=Amycolatopsis sp. NBC_00355 TaxID=2975957 RepID=UPI002E270C41
MRPDIAEIGDTPMLGARPPDPASGMDTNRSFYRYAALKATCTRLAPSGSQETTVDSPKVDEKFPEIINPQAEEIFDLGSGVCAIRDSNPEPAG